MRSVEKAYQHLAAEVVAYVGDDSWDSAGTITNVLNKMTETDYWRKFGDSIHENDRFPDFGVAAAAARAALFIRDDILRTTGQRIWKISFTLYPDGKFNIEYSYTKPEGYEETDEVVTGDEVNESLSRSLGNGDLGK